MDIEQAGHIARELGVDEHGLTLRAIPGGDIARAYVLESSDCRIFIKTLPVSRAGLNSAEADGLQALSETATVRCPKVIGKGVVDDTAWLALEYLDLQSRGRAGERRLGSALARLHRQSSITFGWHRANYIGLTPQPNPRLSDWHEFFLWHRLGHQLDHLDNKHPEDGWSRLRQALFERFQRRFGHHQPPPALIHGDLWTGNAAVIDGDKPVVFDPAVHYADRECDLAMTRLFGGFSEDFYSAYEAEWPLPDDHAERRPWYQLYHLLNHANLFGGGYLGRAREVIDRLSS